MKAHGILMSAPMILAYQAGRKSQTRRTRGLEDVNKNPDAWTFKRVDILNYMTKESAKGKFGAYFESEKIEPRTLSICPVVAPYGGIGDLLYFKETWRLFEREEDGKDFINYQADNVMVDPDWWTKNDWSEISDRYFGKWHPSIFMPKSFSRFRDIPIVNVRIERLQQITDEDARAEGCVSKTGRVQESPREAYFKLWDELNGRKMPSKVNPWVWVYEFKKVAS